MGGGGGYNQRPAPYDRGNRFGGMNRFNNGRGNRGGNRGGGGGGKCNRRYIWSLKDLLLSFIKNFYF